MTTLRLAWFSPLPPARSGVASYTAELVPLLQHELAIDCFPESRAHDFIWQHRRAPYDLVVYQLGNAPFHDYMWPYLVAYPGLVVLHDPRLHHARARLLLSQKRSEEHTSELQSPVHLVCRLLLEKKKKKNETELYKKIKKTYK